MNSILEVDPNLLCPYCDEPLPLNPSVSLTKKLANIRHRTWPTGRIGNSLARTGPLELIGPVCERHRFEAHAVPLAVRNGWPFSVDFAQLRKRVELLREAIQQLVRDPARSSFYSQAVEIRSQSSVLSIIDTSIPG